MTASCVARFGAFRFSSFRDYWTARVLANFSGQIVSVSVSWHVYDLTHDPFDLGMVGLALFAPAFLLVLVTGTVADRFNRVWIMAVCIAGEVLCVLALFLLALWGWHSLPPIFALLVVLGALRAFFGPAQQSLMANIVPASELPSAIAWSASSWQVASICGPVAGGLLYDVSPNWAYGVSAILCASALVCAAQIPRSLGGVGDLIQQARDFEGHSKFAELMAGFGTIWREKIILGAISLDLIAMLLGGATALLPVYARDILSVGPWGLGLLRAAPGVGSILVAAYLLRFPIKDHAGLILLSAVFLVGCVVAVFGLSNDFWLSTLALGLMGGFDMISVFVRETLIQIWTPNSVRGRVNAVNMVVLGASSELGEFRAGLSAWAFGAVPAVVLGGLMMMGVSILWGRWFPQLAKAKDLQKPS